MASNQQYKLLPGQKLQRLSLETDEELKESHQKEADKYTQSMVQTPAFYNEENMQLHLFSMEQSQQIDNLKYSNNNSITSQNLDLNPQFGSNTDLQFINIVESKEVLSDDTNQEPIFTPLQNKQVDDEQHHYQQKALNLLAFKNSLNQMLGFVMLVLLVKDICTCICFETQCLNALKLFAGLSLVFNPKTKKLELDKKSARNQGVQTANYSQTSISRRQSNNLITTSFQSQSLASRDREMALRATTIVNFAAVTSQINNEVEKNQLIQPSIQQDARKIIEVDRIKFIEPFESTFNQNVALNLIKSDSVPPNVSRDAACDRPINNIIMDDSNFNLTVPKEPCISMIQALNTSNQSIQNNNHIQDDLRKRGIPQIAHLEANISEKLRRQGDPQQSQRRAPKRPAESSKFINSHLNQKLMNGPQLSEQVYSQYINKTSESLVSNHRKNYYNVCSRCQRNFNSKIIPQISGCFEDILEEEQKSEDDTRRHLKRHKNRKRVKIGIEQSMHAKSVVELAKSERCQKVRGRESEINEMVQSTLQKNLSSSHFNNLVNFKTEKRSTLDQQHHKCIKVAMASKQQIKYLENKIAAQKEQQIKKVQALEIKLKNTKIFLNMVIHDMRNPTTSIEFAVKEVLKMLQKQMRFLKSSGENMGAISQMVNTLKGYPFTNSSAINGDPNRISRHLEVTEQIPQQNAQLINDNQGVQNVESNYIFNQNQYDEHEQSSSSSDLQPSEEKLPDFITIHQAEENIQASAKGRLEIKNPIVEQQNEREYTINGVSLLQKQVCKDGGKGISLNLIKQLEQPQLSEQSLRFEMSEVEHAYLVPELIALQSTCSPLLFDIKAPKYGRKLIPISNSNPGIPSNQIQKAVSRLNLYLEGFSGRMNSNNSELKSAMSKSRSRLPDEKRQVRIDDNNLLEKTEKIQKIHSLLNQQKSNKLNLTSGINFKAPSFPVITQQIRSSKNKSSFVLTENENEESKNKSSAQPAQQQRFTVTDPIQSLNGSQSSSSEEDDLQDEEQKKEQEYYQTFGKANSQGSNEEEEKQEDEVHNNNSQRQQPILVKYPILSSQNTPQNQFTYASALKSRLQTLNSRMLNVTDLRKSGNHFSSRLLGNSTLQIQYEDIENLLKTANFSASMLLNLINDLLDLAKMECSSFNLNASYFNLEEDVIQQAVSTLSHMIKEKKIQVNVVYSKSPKLSEGNEHLVRCIYSDKARFLQIMLNFLSNAIKFTPEGGCVTIESVVKETQGIRTRDKSQEKEGGGEGTGLGTGNDTGQYSRERSWNNRSIKKIKNDFEMMTAKRCLTPRVRQEDRIQENLKVSTVGENGDRKYIKFEIRIKDSGVGIAKENLSKLFLNFSRLEDHQKCNERGTGLGLSICKSILEKMGGSITVESEGLGTGSTFIMQLQAKCKVIPLYNSNKFSPGMHQNQNLNRPRQFKSQLNMRSIVPKSTFQIVKKSTIGSQMISDVVNPSMLNKKSTFQQIFTSSLNIDFGKEISQGQIQFKQIIVKPQEDPHLTMPLNQGMLSLTPLMRGINVKNNAQSQNLLQVSPQNNNGTSPKFQQHYQSPKHKINMSETNQVENSINIDIQSYGEINVSDEERPRYRLLIANDDTFQLMMMNRVISQFDQFFYKIDQVENGLVAVKKVVDSKNIKSKEYDIVLLDLDMPILDGYGACKQIKDFHINKKQGLHALLQVENSMQDLFYHSSNMNQEAQKANKNQMLVIALTAYLNQEIIEKCIKAGFDDWIESPLTKAKIQTKILDRLDLIRGYTQQTPPEAAANAKVVQSSDFEEEEDEEAKNSCSDDSSSNYYQAENEREQNRYLNLQKFPSREVSIDQSKYQ